MDRCRLCRAPKEQQSSDSECSFCIASSIFRDVSKKTKDMVKRLKETRARSKRMAEKTKFKRD
jgi:hypothetical protein